MTTDIHRLLDDAFAGVEMTPQLQDLKEEIRANLTARVNELMDAGMAAHQADATAMGELGDISELLLDASGPQPASSATDQLAANSGEPTASVTPAPAPGGASGQRVPHRVRPQPAFVLRIVAWSALAVGGVVLAALAAFAAVELPVGLVVALVATAAVGAGLAVTDALLQETTVNYPMPTRRAGGYGLATGAAVLGVGIAGLVAVKLLPVWAVGITAAAAIGAVGGFIVLGLTQTNRRKSWVPARTVPMPTNRFETHPEVAARFGIYTGALWMAATLIAVPLGWATGWAWAGITYLAAVVVMMIMLARMMYPPRGEHEGRSRKN